MTSFSELKLAEPLARALAALGYDTPTPIQQQAIPHLIDGRDMLGIAQTGTGKTAAFALPALNWIFTEAGDPPKRGARVLVLAPTRELVGQIYDSFMSYGRFMMDLNAAKITGGVSINHQIKKLVGGNDVLVATPGRLIDLLDRKAITLKDVEVLILDEADQMMDMGFIHALKKLIPLLPEERQTVFLSATLPPKIKTLANQFLSDPVQISVTPANSTAERVEQSLIYANKAEKPHLLADRLLRPDVERTLVFTRTKHGADRVVKRLAQVGLKSIAIHGNKSQGQRQRALAAFKDGTVDILVATDVAARGIDIPNISHVINYEIPNVPEQYVHRIGRTARAQASGQAIAFVASDERPYLKDIQKLLGETIPVEEMPSDMAARIKVLEARDKVEPVNLMPDVSRKGRGKSGKKKDRSRGKSRKTETQPGAEPRDANRSKTRHGAKHQPKQKADHTSKETTSDRKRSNTESDTHSRNDEQGFRRRRRSADAPAAKKPTSSASDGRERKAPPKRKPQPQSRDRAQTRSAKPGGSDRSSNRRKAPTRNKGGDQPLKRRGR